MCLRCNFEAQVAHHMFQEQGRLNNLIVVLPSSIPSAYLNKTLRYILKTRTYIEWKSDSPQFWKRLRATIATPGSLLLVGSITNMRGVGEIRIPDILITRPTDQFQKLFSGGTHCAPRLVCIQAQHLLQARHRD